MSDRLIEVGESHFRIIVGNSEFVYIDVGVNSQKIFRFALTPDQAIELATAITDATLELFPIGHEDELRDALLPAPFRK